MKKKENRFLGITSSLSPKGKMSWENEEGGKMKKESDPDTT